ncbi:Gp15 family bacteriophage protein [Halalkalibacter hemicellulosilyticus]|uniref:Phage protein n=1 Tax=Halalkalibacter hemicellulosilyticusJCM 9152 TaxID=1236971 RepID=W4QMA3_9BACI|nr:Gp15 family bacteriophage protein [Halalkalibacter hemicellulosilyticus]GAE32449.1 phage protein [Halalkalibacter hemicellulosilyticusJCM 9152]
MRLNDPLVTSFVFEGIKYQIDLAFDNVLDVFDVLDDKALRDYERVEVCLSLLLGEEQYDQSSTINLWNYVYEQFIHIKEEESILYDRKGNPLPVKTDEEKEKLIDLEKDAEYIFASFRQAYGMNLFHEQGKLRWEEFQALLNGLPSNTIMKRIIEIRSWKPSKGDSAEFRQNMKDLQRKFSLNDKEVDDDE